MKVEVVGQIVAASQALATAQARVTECAREFSRATRAEVEASKVWFHDAKKRDAWEAAGRARAIAHVALDAAVGAYDSAAAEYDRLEAELRA